MSDPTPYEAGMEAAKRAIADRARRRKKRELRWSSDDYHAFNSDWEQFLAGWMQAIKEDKERQLSWEEFYFPAYPEAEE